jgi:hypothetical protein
LATSTANASALTAFRSLVLLDIIDEYDCGGPDVLEFLKERESLNYPG